MPDQLDDLAPLRRDAVVAGSASDAVEVVAAARMLGIQAGDVYAIITAGQLEGTLVNGRMIVTRASIARYAEWRDARRGWVRDDRRGHRSTGGVGS